MPDNPLQRIRERAADLRKHIVLAEGEDPRVLRAAVTASREELAEVTLLGSPAEIERVAKTEGLSLVQVTVEDPRGAAHRQTLIDEALIARGSKGITLEQAAELVDDPLFHAALMVRSGLADGAVSGAVASTPEVLRAGIQIIGLAPEITTASGSFLIQMPEREDLPRRTFFFADSGVVPDPTPEQLCSIAICTAHLARQLLALKPKVAFLSFSTKGSANHPHVEKVRDALRLMEEHDVDFDFDGELQLDAAIVPDVGSRKAPHSPVAGQANILIFPDLDSGNIGYKLAERLGGASATGPIVQGLAKPFNDLSRGCNSEDVINAIAITALMSVNP